MSTDTRDSQAFTLRDSWFSEYLSIKALYSKGFTYMTKVQVFYFLVMGISGLFGITREIYALSRGGASLLRWIFRRKDPFIYSYPKRTVRLVPSPLGGDNWWRISRYSSGTIKTMIDGTLMATNVTDLDVTLIAVEMRKPRIYAPLTRVYTETPDEVVYPVFVGARGTAHVHFTTELLGSVAEEGGTLSASVAVVDQFGNRNWIRNFQFKYRR